MTSRRQRRRIKLIVWGALVLLCICLVFVPYQSGTLRKALVGGVFLAWVGGLFLFWQSILARVLFLLPLGAAVGLALMPYRNSSSARMQVSYTTALRSYLGTPYFWGGENHRGIDCSGLIRAAMIDTCLAEGWRTKDLGLLRSAAALWWYDASAKEIGEGYSGRTFELRGNTTTLNTTDYSKLQPGDLAVTASGQHILAYLGERTWINADPKGKFTVVTKTAPDEKDAWFSTPMKIVRWFRLQ